MPIPDPVEHCIRQALLRAKVQFEHDPRLDFYLPKFDVWIECKQFYSSRADRQLKDYDNVILIQGMRAAQAFASMLNPDPAEPGHMEPTQDASSSVS